MKKKYFMLGLLMLGMASTAMAEDVKTVSVIGVDGSTTQEAAMASVQKIELSDSSVYVTVSDGEATSTYTFVRKNVDKILFSITEGTGISATPAAAAGEVKISAQGSTVSVSGVKAGTPVAVYSLSGSVVLSTKATDSSVSLDATSLDDGIYIVRAGSKAIKIVKK